MTVKYNNTHGNSCFRHGAITALITVALTYNISNSAISHSGVQAFSPSHIRSPSLLNAFHPSYSSCPSSTRTRTISTTSLFSSDTKKLSRPERKALEREKKQNKKNGKNKSMGSPKKDANDHKYALHSNNISELTGKSTADDVIKAIKRAQNRHDIHDLRIIENFLLEEVGEGFAYGYRGSLLARLAVAALHMSQDEIARKAIMERRSVHRPAMLPMESAAIIRGLLRVHNVTDAFEVLHDELKLPLPGTPIDSPENKDTLKHRSYSIASIASRHFFEEEPKMAVKACKMMAKLGPMIRESGLTIEELNMPWARLIQGAAQCESRRRNGSLKEEVETEVSAEGPTMNVDVELPCNLVYAVLNAMCAYPSQNDDLTYESLSNALVRRTLFITGAVDIEGCPKADRGEVVFIGRSNVGKSSLVNMVTNRKSLAYTSKRPGKTQQFNFFSVNDKPGKEKEVKYGDYVPGHKDPDAFYILDVPGFGFAKVPEKQRQAWSDFLSQYIQTRKTLKVVFHLIDGRHGPIDEDHNIMKQMGEIKPKGVKYVIVLTKADKNIKGPSTTNSGKVSKSVVEKVRKAAKQHNVGNAPILLTSSQTKLGRDEMWRFMRTAAEV